MILDNVWVTGRCFVLKPYGFMTLVVWRWLVKLGSVDCPVQRDFRFKIVSWHAGSLCKGGISHLEADIIHEVFLPFDASAILSIPLSLTLPDDRLIWASTSSGLFYVSSAYRVTRTFMGGTQLVESSCSQHLASFWRSIWKLPMPNKIKAFAWRACRNILPTKANLHSRKVIPDNICEECGVAVESSGHVFWHCARAKEVWSAANVEFGADLGVVSEFLDLVWYARLVKQWSSQALASLFTIAWGIWSNRNEIRAGGARKSASTIAHWTMDLLGGVSCGKS
nr:putative ribonuclease h protein [Quercus suber]